MASVILTLKIMPASPEVDLAQIEEQAKKLVEQFGADWGKCETEPVAFGLKCLKPMFVLDEGKGSPDDLEKEISEIEGVQSVDVIDVRRTIG